MKVFTFKLHFTNYPEIELKLSDVANIEYIQLKSGKDSILINGFTNKARELFRGFDNYMQFISILSAFCMQNIVVYFISLLMKTKYQ